MLSLGLNLALGTLALRSPDLGLVIDLRCMSLLGSWYSGLLDVGNFSEVMPCGWHEHALGTLVH